MESRPPPLPHESSPSRRAQCRLSFGVPSMSGSSQLSCLYKICITPFIVTHHNKSRTHRRHTFTPKTDLPTPTSFPPASPLCALPSSTTPAFTLPFYLSTTSYLPRACLATLPPMSSPHLLFMYIILLIHPRYHILPAAVRMGPMHTSRLIP